MSTIKNHKSTPSSRLSKPAQLRRLLESDQLGFLMEAHNGISARIVEETGFEAIWASGLTMSAALGVRDNNEATWTQVLELVEFMSDHTSIPILLDGDSGYGDYNTTRRLVRKLESRGIAGVCIEDKLFPKTNSFINGTGQTLAPIDEFSGKIKSAKDAQSDDQFVVIARVEAFIAGWGLEEAMRRAEAYHAAGADAILMHSAKRSPEEVFAFAREWEQRCPVVLVPTKYYTTPTSAFREHHVAAVIWANHLLRAAICAMESVAQEIYTEQCLTSIEDRIATIAEVFRLQGADELAEAERRYLPRRAEETKAVVLAFARGDEMSELTVDRPKAMVTVGGKPILEHIANAYRAAGIKDIHVIRGYRKSSVNIEGVSYLDSPTTKRLDEVHALSAALDALNGNVIISYGDVLFRKFIVNELSESDADFCIMIDTSWKSSRNRDRHADYVVCDLPPSEATFYDHVFLERVLHDDQELNIHGEWMGFLKMSAKGAEICRNLVATWLTDSQALADVDMGDLLNRLVDEGHRIQVLFTSGNWIDCDSARDAIDGSRFT